MKKQNIHHRLAWICILMCLLTACQNIAPPSSEPPAQTAQLSQPENPAASSAPDQSVVFTDALGNEVTLHHWDRVVSLYGSFAEAWMLAGGSLVGVSDDAIKERNLSLPEDIILLGGNKDPNLEEVLAAEPDFLILSADAPGQAKLHDALTQASVPHAYFRINTFQDYQNMMELFCLLTGQEALYQKNVLDVASEIERIKQLVSDQPQPTVLYLRAFSTGVKAKAEDNQTGVMLRELGADNIAARHPSLLEDISMEEIIAEDPDFILMTVMGASEKKGLDYMKEHVENNPAWSELSAVKNGRYLLLPKDLFHYKPNARWGESYAYLAKILYPELATQIDRQ